jgi:hypothetical protein
MNTGLIVLLLVGIILMTANTAKARSQKTPTNGSEKVIYKYLPLDIDAFYRQEFVSKPSKLYYSMFSNEDLKR